MKLIFALVLLTTAAFAQEAKPLDFDWTQLKDIWESPELQPTAKRLFPNYDLKRGGRIINGVPAAVGQFPHHVLLVIDNAYWCGGSLLSSYWVLTVSRSHWKQIILFVKYYDVSNRLHIASTADHQCRYTLSSILMLGIMLPVVVH